MIIREAEDKDLERCARMASDFYDVAGYKEHIPFCYESCIDMLSLCKEQGMLFVAEYEGIVGFISGVCMPVMTNRKYLAATELAWWVEPGYRKGTTGIKLLKALENAAKESGASIFSMMNLESQSPDKTEKIYKSLGYEKTENTFTKVM